MKTNNKLYRQGNFHFNETGLCNHFFLSATLRHFLHTNFGLLTIAVNLSNLSSKSFSLHLHMRFSFLAIVFPPFNEFRPNTRLNLHGLPLRYEFREKSVISGEINIRQVVFIFNYRPLIIYHQYYIILLLFRPHTQ